MDHLDDFLEEEDDGKKVLALTISVIALSFVIQAIIELLK